MAFYLVITGFGLHFGRFLLKSDKFLSYSSGHTASCEMGTKFWPRKNINAENRTHSVSLSDAINPGLKLFNCFDFLLHDSHQTKLFMIGSWNFYNSSDTIDILLNFLGIFSVLKCVIVRDEFLYCHRWQSNELL